MSTVTALLHVTAARIVSPSTYVPPEAGDEVNRTPDTLMLASTLRPASPVVASPPRVRTTSVVPFRSVAPFARNTTVASVAEAVCSHTPSASTSPGLTVYSKVSVSVPEPETYPIALRLFARSVSSAPRSRRRLTLALEPPFATVTGLLHVTAARIVSPST